MLPLILQISSSRHLQYSAVSQCAMYVGMCGWMGGVIFVLKGKPKYGLRRSTDNMDPKLAPASPKVDRSLSNYLISDGKWWRVYRKV